MRTTLFAGLVTLAFFAAAETSVWGQSPPDNQPEPVRYFLDEPPDVSELSRVPAGARDAFIARVKILGRIGGLLPRHPAPPFPRDLLYADIAIVEVVHGQPPPASEIGVRFGEVGPDPRIHIPRTLRPLNLARDYFVICFVDEDGRRRLLSFPSTVAEYERWYDEMILRIR